MSWWDLLLRKFHEDVTWVVKWMKLRNYEIIQWMTLKRDERKMREEKFYSLILIWHRTKRDILCI